MYADELDIDNASDFRDDQRSKPPITTFVIAFGEPLEKEFLFEHIDAE